MVWPFEKGNASNPLIFGDPLVRIPDAPIDFKKDFTLDVGSVIAP